MRARKDVFGWESATGTDRTMSVLLYYRVRGILDEVKQLLKTPAKGYQTAITVAKVLHGQRFPLPMEPSERALK